MATFETKHSALILFKFSIMPRAGEKNIRHMCNIFILADALTTQYDEQRLFSLNFDLIDMKDYAKWHVNSFRLCFIYDRTHFTMATQEKNMMFYPNVRPC